MTNIKTIAMYLPQFHQIAENDEWWGQGFTEWTAVKAATPLFQGHKQPKKPYKENYYNLLEKTTMQQQAGWMNEYGVDGLCFYHYYFKDGRKILERPAENLLQWKDVDMPFCFCWANESWARTWSKLGNKNSWSEKFEKKENSHTDKAEVLLEQKYGREAEWKEHFEYLVPFFQDKRYIKKNRSPVFLIYKPEDIVCLSQMIGYWKELAKGYDIEDIYVIGLNINYKKKGLDAVLLNAPASFWNPAVRGGNLQPKRENGVKIYSYDDIWRNILSSEPVDGSKTYFGGFAGYDEAPRRNRNATVVQGGTAEKFRYYIKELAKKNFLAGNEFVFINAWNEWGEGMYLEPDAEYEFQYLEAVRDCKNDIKASMSVQEECADGKADFIHDNTELLNAINKYRLISGCLDEWMALREKNINPADYLKKSSYKRIAMYGMGILGRHFLYDLEKAGVEVAYIIDRRVELKHPKLDIKGLEDDLENVDAVVVTAIADFDEIFDSLKGKVNCPIISIAEMIREI